MQIDEILIHFKVTKTPKLKQAGAHLGPMLVALVQMFLAGMMRAVGVFRGMFAIFPACLVDDSLLCISH